MDAAVRFRKRGSKYGLVTDKGRVVVPFVFDEVLPFCWGYGVGRVTEVWGQTPVQARLLVGHEQYEPNEYLITLDCFTQR